MRRSEIKQSALAFGVTAVGIFAAVLMFACFYLAGVFSVPTR
jgi:hypothetical protein